MSNKKFVDLQIHSVYSDGYKTPTELVAYLRQYSIKVAALTDHNSVGGIPEFSHQASKAGIKVIPGIEIYARYRSFIFHVLGYDFDVADKNLAKVLKNITDRKYSLLKHITPKLKKKGIMIYPEKLAREPASYIGMNNLVRHLERNSHNRAVIKKALGKNKYEHWEIYMKYFAPHCITAYPEIAIPIDLAIKTIQRAGGTAVLAHPGQQLHFEQDWVLDELIRKGIKGIECFSSHHSYSQTAHYMRYAHNKKIIATGGSDYHGDLESHLAIDRFWDYTLLPFELYERIAIF